ncbi:MAG: DNA polymerase III subunit beta [Spirochaetales bacterium]|nr:DNA polymerase III subunit beta [Spirochaetales bacterium]
MKFSCDKDIIIQEISIAQDIISSRNALSILSNVLLEAKNDTLTIKATDLKVGFETLVPVHVEQEGSTTVFCDKLLGILKTLPPGVVQFTLQDGHIHILPQKKKASFKLKSIPAEQYPELQMVSSENYFTLSQKDLNEMIAQTIFSVSDDESRYFMNGVFFEKENGGIVMVATDGRRLSYARKTLETEIPDFNGVIIPPKILHLIRKLSSGEGRLDVAVTDKNIWIRFDNRKLSSHLIEGQFPNYHRVIPESQEYTVTTNREDFLEALKRVSLMVEQKSRRIYLSLEDGVLSLLSEESDIGAAQEEIACEYSGSGTKIALNYLYLIDPLKEIEGDQVHILFTEPNKAITLKPVKDSGYFHIIMPMQLD